MSHAWIQTYLGRKLYPLSPRAEDIDIRDIAHSLSMLCRFTGHCRTFYSVAQHSVLVSQNCCQPLWGLLHDAPEAYLGDMSRPIKREPEMMLFRLAEKHLMAAVCQRFGLDPEEPASVRRADTMLLVTEARDLMGTLHPEWHHRPEHGYEILPERIKPAYQHEAERMFLERFAELTGERFEPIATAWGTVA